MRHYRCLLQRSILILNIALAASGCGSPGRDRGDSPLDLSAKKDGGGQTCVGLQCQIANCQAGEDTVLTGRLFAPNGKDPVPRAQVYVPNLGLPEFPKAVSCDLCNEVTASAAHTETSFDGSFKLGRVPSGTNIPVVFQLGRFRRVLRLNIASCQTAAVPADTGSPGVRLPSRMAETDPNDSIPRIAVGTGDYDQIECVLRRMGLQEFDLYNGRSPGQPPQTVGELSTLLTDKNKLMQYNILVVNCTENQFQTAVAQQAVQKNLAAFVGAGGRLYATDWAYDVIEQVPEFAPYLCFQPQRSGHTLMCGPTPQSPGNADSNSPYSNNAQILDMNLAAWLAQFPGVMDNQKRVSVAYSFVVVDSVGQAPMHPTTTWVQGETNSFGTKPMTVTFDYNQCGRVHYSTYNTEPNGVVPSNQRYPNCKADFSPQERILEYLVFEIASCVGIPG